MRSGLHQYISILHILLLITPFVNSTMPETVIEALVDGSAKMPCDVLQRRDDSVEFIFWYKNDGVTALYTLDARDRKLIDAYHMKNETYSDRVQFHVDGNDLYLEMDKLKEEDTGSYFCRVDYQWSATELKKVSLIVVVPPKKVIIRDDSDQEVSDVAGPYKEKSDVSLLCEAQKGYPSPNVTWWKDNKLWDNTFKKVSGNVINEMRLTNISRADLFATFHCKVQNTKLDLPITRTIILDLYLYPLTVKITSKVSALSAGRVVEMSCETIGSRPSAKVTWWLNGTLLSDHIETVHDNVTSSVLRIHPKLQYHKSPLVCRAENPKLYHSHVENIRLLNITFLPQVSLRLIKEEEDRMPKEDDFIRLICDIVANPPVLKIGWQFNDLPLSHNESQTVSGDTLFLRDTIDFRRLSRRNAGKYRCSALNDEGRGYSQEMILNISHAPVCKENQQITYVVGLNESVIVRCEVEAMPTDVTFKWEFSNTVRKHYYLQHVSEGVVSNATYRPMNLADYGTLFCWANNSIGHQQSSCFFTVIAPACKTDKANANASTSSRDGSDSIWQHSAITAGAGVVISILIISVISAIYFRRMYMEKKNRPMGVA
ncbi:neural cell adhesion molecule 2 [Parasteatoda tepidariorum]|uniref:neural cell adhesion molecule 2 n=1 Tax=Parasteatoda tepidariorum TaxID=114398 RepID=UPI00077FCDF2|nr:hemicentin-2 [Parasteatoda tepidariorum]XP_015927705.1 hemicentin-2 [Parasteatoda tepidariorum]